MSTPIVEITVCRGCNDPVDLGNAYLVADGIFHLRQKCLLFSKVMTKILKIPTLVVVVEELSK